MRYSDMVRGGKKYDARKEEWKRELNVLRNTGKIIFPHDVLPSEELTEEQGRKVLDAMNELFTEDLNPPTQRMVNAIIMAAFDYDKRKALRLGATGDWDHSFTKWDVTQIDAVLRIFSVLLLKKGMFGFMRYEAVGERGVFRYCVTLNDIPIDGILEVLSNEVPRYAAEPLVELLCWTLYQRLLTHFDPLNKGEALGDAGMNAYELLNEICAWPVTPYIPEEMEGRHEYTVAVFAGDASKIEHPVDAMVAGKVAGWQMEAETYSGNYPGLFAVIFTTGVNLRMEFLSPVLSHRGMEEGLQRLRLYMTGWGRGQGFRMVEFDGEAVPEEKIAREVLADTAYHKAVTQFLDWYERLEQGKEPHFDSHKYLMGMDIPTSETHDYRALLHLASLNEFRPAMHTVCGLWNKEYRRGLWAGVLSVKK